MLIRFANTNDYIAIKNIVKESFDFKALKDEFAIYLKERDILLAIKDDKEVACAIYEIIQDIFAGKKVLFVNYLCVKKEFRALGIGKALIKKIKQIACELGVDSIELTCADFRQNSHQFYLANDFSVKKTKVFICESFKNDLMGGGSSTYINISSIKNKDVA
ncbi:MAG: GNAT family N-acetyltransferase [Campylobacter sp.]|nr:GNAT family N-acetyltransferase [Campylobacter sp.]